MGNLILQEETYREQMEQTVIPYLEERENPRWLEREEDKYIFCVRYQADKPKGVVVISHGFRESAEKYKEVAYYFLKMGYSVYIPEHCGHGRSYRLTEDLSLVHVDNYKRYVQDFIFVSKLAKKENFKLPLYVFAHSMGGGIAAAAAAEEPRLYKKIILSSPMIRPRTANVPWREARTIARGFCKSGYPQRYVAGQKAYEGAKPYEKSSSLSKARYDYYQEIRSKEPMFQTNGASYGWLYAAAHLNRDLQKEDYKKIKAPILLFQAEKDSKVSKKEQVRFIFKLNANGASYAKLVRVPHTKHEIFSADKKTITCYWRMVFQFLDNTVL